MTKSSRIPLAIIVASMASAMVALGLLQALFVIPRSVLFVGNLAYGLGFSLVFVGITATVLHLVLKRKAQEPYLAYAIAGGAALGIGFLARAWLVAGVTPIGMDVRALLALPLAGAAGGWMFRFVLGASAARTSVALGVVLSPYLGFWVVEKVREENKRTRAETRLHRGPVVSGATDARLLQLGETIRRLVESGDVEAFVRAAAVSAEDWTEAMPKNATVLEHPLGDDPALRLRRASQTVADSGRHVFEVARRVGIDGDRVRFRVKTVTAHQGGHRRYKAAPAPDVRIDVLTAVTVTLAGESVSGAPGDAHLRGDYQLRVGALSGFPGGWRIDNGIRWAGFPERVADEATQRELALVERVSEGWFERRSLALADDELLAKMADAFIDLLRRRSAADFAKAVTMGREETLELEKRLEWGTPEQAESNFHQMGQDAAASAQGMLDVLARLGVDLSDAEFRVKSATAEGASFGQWAFGTPEGLRSNGILFTFAVQSGRKLKDGNAVSGDYVVKTDSAMRKGTRWVLFGRRTRWKELPPAVMTKSERERLAFEDYAIEHMSLPPGMVAPDIAMARLDTGANVNLSDYRGKVVVLEWWASWCGPCQDSMADLQKLPGENPAWVGRVAVLALSIDGAADTARNHAAKRGWNKATNLWSGPGAGRSPAAEAFRVSAVPTAYVVDANGRIAGAREHRDVPVAKLVTAALNGLHP